LDNICKDCTSIRNQGRKWRAKSVINYKVCDNDESADEEGAVRVLSKEREQGAGSSGVGGKEGTVMKRPL
jgi:hypothetical protein